MRIDLMRHNFILFCFLYCSLSFIPNKIMMTDTSLSYLESNFQPVDSMNSGLVNTGVKFGQLQSK